VPIGAQPCIASTAFFLPPPPPPPPPAAPQLDLSALFAQATGAAAPAV
jgi:hypothetical protein